MRDGAPPFGHAETVRLVEEVYFLLTKRFSRRPPTTVSALERLLHWSRELEEDDPGPVPRVQAWLDAASAAVDEDAAAHLAKIPTVRTLAEAVAVLPGLRAVSLHRFANIVSNQRFRVGARLLAEAARQSTGIEIAPTAVLGPRIVISHGMGIVVGATAKVGADAHLFHGVTLGASGISATRETGQRHPTLEDDVTVYANATILGGRTVIGRGCVTGAGALVRRSLPPGTVLRAAT